MRLFVAINLPDHVLHGISKLVEQLRASAYGVRWARLENIHLTLKFLGEVTPPQVEDVISSLAGCLADKSVVELRLVGMGVFPDVRRPRVVWLGVGGNRALSNLEEIHRDVDEGLARLGFEPDARPFRPHMTIGRMRRVRGKGAGGRAGNGVLVGARLERLLERVDAPDEAFRVDSIELMESVLGPSGAKYATVSSFALNPAWGE